MDTLPLHPALVHLPIALVLFAPIFAAYIALEIARVGRLLQANPAGDSEAESEARKTAQEYARRRWSLVVIWMFLQTALIYGTMVSGEQDADLMKANAAFADRAENLAAIDAHENAAGLLLLASAAGLFAALIAWKPGASARLWRRITLGVQLLALIACLHTARLGGELVYQHGAAGVHMEAAARDDETQE